MQSTSATWRSLWASGAALEAAAVIGEDTFAVAAAPVITRGLMQDGLSVGNVVSASCALSLRTDATIPKSAEVTVKMRLKDGATTSEWLPAGTFFISRRSRDPVTGVLTLECYDALLKANAAWEPSTGSWPRSAAGVVAEIAGLLDLTTDPRTALPSGNLIPEPAAGTTLREALGGVAAMAGGNWIVTPANRLRLVPVLDADAPGDADAADVSGVLGGLWVGSREEITGARCVSEGESYLYGDETGAVARVPLAPMAAADAAEALLGMTWQAFEIATAVYDPAAELGDFLRAGANGEIRGWLCAETVTLGPAFRGDISAPGPAELADEYPYIGPEQRDMRVLRAAVAQAGQSAASASAAVAGLNQQELFRRLTNNGRAQGMLLANGQLYVNASYIQTGMIADATGDNSWNLNTGALSTQKGMIGDFTLDDGALTYSGDSSSAYLGKDGLYYTSTDGATSKVSVDGNHLSFVIDGQVVGQLYAGVSASTGDRTLYINAGQPTETAGYAIRVVNGYGRRDDLIRLYYPVEMMDTLDVTNEVTCGTLFADSVNTTTISGGTAWRGGVIGVSYGGTGASSAAAARRNLDVYSKAEVDALLAGANS